MFPVNCDGSAAGEEWGSYIVSCYKNESSIAVTGLGTTEVVGRKVTNTFAEGGWTKSDLYFPLHGI